MHRFLDILYELALGASTDDMIEYWTALTSDMPFGGGGRLSLTKKSSKVQNSLNPSILNPKP